MRSASIIDDLIASRRDDAARAVALVGAGGLCLTYTDLAHHVERLAAGLAGAGVTRHDRVAIVLPNGPAMAVAFLGVTRVAIAAPLNPAYQDEEFAFYLGDLGAKALIVDAGSASPAVGAAKQLGIDVIELGATFELAGAHASHSGQVPRAAPDDLALVLHTSGTTSRPKLVPLTQANLVASAFNVAQTLQLGPHDRCLNVMPLFHIHGLVAALLASLAARASVACTPGFSAVDFRAWLDEFRPTWYTAVPTMHQAALARLGGVQLREHTLRFIRSSSAALPVQTLEELEAALGVSVIEAYGMTEAAHQMASNPLPPEARKPGSVGPAAGPDVAIMDAAGGLLAPGEHGEVVIRGANVTAGYLDNPAANAAAFTDGWFRTGDEGYLDEDGYLHLTGRLKEIINRGGEKVAPLEVDQVLMDHPAVAQAVTFAIPDARLGEDVAAAIVLKHGAEATPHDVQRFAAERLAYFKVPRKVVIVEEIPKGPTGKLQRIGLADRLNIDVTAPARFEVRAPRTNGLDETIASIWRRLLKTERIDADDDFFALGGSSLLAVEFVAELSAATGIDLPLYDFFDAPTIEGLTIALARRREAAETVAADANRLVVPLRQHGSQSAFLFSHGQYREGFAVPAYCLALAEHLGAEQPFYVLQPNVERATSIEVLARAQIEELHALRAGGPYIVGGYCSGAPLALEVAQQLVAAGEEVRSLVLIEAAAPSRRREALQRVLGGACGLLGPRRKAKAHGLLDEQLGSIASTSYLAFDPQSALEPPPIEAREERAYRRALAAHRQRRYAGTLTLLLPEEEHSPFTGQTLGWRRFADEVQVHAIPGGHSTCITSHTRALADRLNALVGAGEARA